MTALNGSCVVCSAECSSLLDCSTCQKPTYCSNTCRYKDSTNELHSCLPYTILHEDRCGRLLMASRDIKAGEIIFADTPAAVGPDNNPKPVCLTCYKRLPGLTYRCRYCSWPLCSPYCQDDKGPHARECSLFQIHSPRFTIENYKVSCPSYNAIMVLRLLWLRDNNEKVWNLINILMDHLEEDKEITKTKREVISFIRDHCKLTQFSQQEILHVMGVVDTNAYIIGENPNKDVDLQGLFPITSILNHACTANTLCYATNDFTFVCKAVTDIRKGEELSTNYLHYHYHFFGLTYRNPELSSFWHFNCDCRRCKDPSEFSTFSDSLVCSECTVGRLLPLKDTSEGEWICGTCYSSQPRNHIINTINTWWNTLEDYPKTDVPKLMALLQRMQEVFDTNHYYCMEVKRRVIENIGELKGFEYESVAAPWLEKKVHFCEDHLKLQKDLAPGLSEYCAYISGHCGEALYWLTRKQYIALQIAGPEAAVKMEEAAKHLLKVVQIWGPYRRRSAERLRAEEARTILESIEEKYVHTPLLNHANSILDEDDLAE